MSWDLENLRKLAGLNEGYSTQLNESWDDEDEDPDVARAEREAKKRKIKLPDTKVDAEKDLTHISGSKKSAAKEKADEEAEKKEAAERAAEKKREAAEAPKADDEDEKPVAKKETSHEKHEKSESAAKEKAEHAGKTPSKEVEKKETPAEEKKEEAKVAEAKRRGKAPNADSKRQRLHAHMKANPSEKRSALLKWAFDNLQMGPAYASQQIQAVKASLKTEGYMLRHPSMPKFVLHENGAMGMFQWISETDENLEPLMFATESEAKKVASYLLSYKNQLADIVRIDLDADEA